MHYPIFKSIVNTIDTQLEKRGVNSTKYRTWEDNKINAIGLELIIDLEKISSFIHSLAINFDWDSFREASVAKKLEGMKEHPFLKIDQLTKSNIPPSIDIEMSWLFNIDVCQPTIYGKEGNYRIEEASKWMESISKEINSILKNENIITRWHIEIEGDENGRYLSAINLISYFQYEFTNLATVNEVNTFISRRLQDLLLKANRVINKCETVLKTALVA